MTREASYVGFISNTLGGVVTLRNLNTVHYNRKQSLGSFCITNPIALSYKTKWWQRYPHQQHFLSKRLESTKMQVASTEELKRMVGYRAVDDHIQSGMIVGLGTGSTAYYAVERLGQKLQQKQLSDIVAIPTSVKTQKQAESLHIPLVTLDTHPTLDVAIDGADEVDKELNLVKGRGGALLREKMVEVEARKLVIIVDETKLVSGLGISGAMPVEVTPFCWKRTMRRLLELSALMDCGVSAILRQEENGTTYITDNNNYIIDLYFQKVIPDSRKAARELIDIVGVVEHGLFLDMADVCIVAGKDGVRVMESKLASTPEKNTVGISAEYIANKFYADRKFPYPRKLEYRISGKEPKYVEPQIAVSSVRSGDNIYLQSVAAAPQILVEALTSVVRDSDRKQITLHHILVDGEAPFLSAEFEGKIKSNSLFIGSNYRKAVNEGLADYTPVFLGEVPLLFRRRIIPVDVAFVQVSPPDKYGYVSLGVSVDITLSALEVARERIAVVNPHMPRTLGDALIHISQLDHLVYEDKPLPQLSIPKEDNCRSTIGQLIAENLIRDGACLQTGIGAIPDAILKSLRQHKNLGVHTEMFSDGLVELIENGNVTNEFKKIEPGKVISSFLLGTERLYRFVDNNPLIVMRDCAFTNNPAVIGMNDNVIAVNAALEVDLTGQICSDSIGETFYSGFGGQVDFMRGAALSENGKAIIALPSLSGKRNSRIVPIIKPGGGVVTTRAHADYVVTEYGIAQLKGKPVRERAKALINIAHPNFREELEKEAKRRHLL
eukprot:jgi/Galph1/151/GphlegSOOS_G4996.1